MGWDTVIDVLGSAAGVLVAGALLPQIWRTHMRRSGADLSLSWQVTLAVGLALQLVYLYHNAKWAVFVPLSCELVFILYLAGLKLYYEDRLFIVGPRIGDWLAVGRKTAGISWSEDYQSIAGASSGGEEEPIRHGGTTGTSGGGGGGGGDGGGDGGGGEGDDRRAAAAADPPYQAPGHAEKGRPANADEDPSSAS